MDDEKEEIYIIPHNFNDGGGVFRGMFRLRNVIEGFIMALVTGFPIYKLFPVPSYVKLIMIPIISGSLLIFGCAGINDEPVSINVRYMFKFLLSRRKLVFKKVRQNEASYNGSRRSVKQKKKSRNKGTSNRRTGTR